MVKFPLYSWVSSFAPYITPFPEHVKTFTDFANASKSPNGTYWFGTDEIGRDIFTRVIFGYRFSLLMGLVVLSIVVPIGVVLGLIAGYYQNSWVDILIMRITDIFLAVPSLILALSVASILEPNLFNAMLAVCLTYGGPGTRA